MDMHILSRNVDNVPVRNRKLKWSVGVRKFDVKMTMMKFYLTAITYTCGHKPI